MTRFFDGYLRAILAMLSKRFEPNVGTETTLTEREFKKAPFYCSQFPSLPSVDVRYVVYGKLFVWKYTYPLVVVALKWNQWKYQTVFYHLYCVHKKEQLNSHDIGWLTLLDIVIIVMTDPEILIIFSQRKRKKRNRFLHSSFSEVVVYGFNNK